MDRFVNMICTHPAFKLKLTQDQKERLLFLSQLLEIKMAAMPGHPVYLKAQGKNLTQAEKDAFKESAKHKTSRTSATLNSRA